MDLLALFWSGFLQKLYEKKKQFLMQISNIQFNIYYMAEFYDHTFSATKMPFLPVWWETWIKKAFS